MRFAIDYWKFTKLYRALDIHTIMFFFSFAKNIFFHVDIWINIRFPFTGSVILFYKRWFCYFFLFCLFCQWWNIFGLNFFILESVLSVVWRGQVKKDLSNNQHMFFSFWHLLFFWQKLSSFFLGKETENLYVLTDFVPYYACYAHTRWIFAQPNISEFPNARPSFVFSLFPALKCFRHTNSSDWKKSGIREGMCTFYYL